MLGCYPAGASGDKYWCPVNRIDNVYGDKHLVCTRPPMANDNAAANCAFPSTSSRAIFGPSVGIVEVGETRRANSPHAKSKPLNPAVTE
jgi:hypothetical protein